MSEQAIDAIYKAHAKALFSYSVSLGFDRDTSMDAVHDVFCKLCADKKVLATIVNMRYCLLRSLKNRLLDLDKRRKETVGLPLEKLAEELPFSVHATIEDELIAGTYDEESLLSAGCFDFQAARNCVPAIFGGPGL